MKNASKQGRPFAILLLSALIVSPLVAQPQPEKPIPPREVKEKQPEQPPADEEKLDVSKTSERIADNAQKASDRLKEKDPGNETRQMQKDILRDLDALIKQAQNPPPSSGSSSPMSPMNPPPKEGEQQPMPMSGQPPKSGQQPMPMGGEQPKDGQQPMPKGGQQPKGGQPPKGGAGASPKQGSERGERNRSGRERRQPREPREPKGEQPHPSGQPMAKSPSTPKSPNPKEGMAMEPKEGKPTDPKEAGFGKASPKRQNDPLADLYKDAWGSLPDRMRQEMDLYYREEFMPRYSELLKQYYASIAEQQKKKDGR